MLVPTNGNNQRIGSPPAPGQSKENPNSSTFEDNTARDEEKHTEAQGDHVSHPGIKTAEPSAVYAKNKNPDPGVTDDVLAREIQHLRIPEEVPADNVKSILKKTETLRTTGTGNKKATTSKKVQFSKEIHIRRFLYQPKNNLLPQDMADSSNLPETTEAADDKPLKYRKVTFNLPSEMPDYFKLKFNSIKDEFVYGVINESSAKKKFQDVKSEYREFKKSGSVKSTTETK